MKLNNNLYSIQETAQRVGISAHSLRSWCRWWESLETKPSGIRFPIIKKLGSNQMRMFDEGDIILLSIFKKQLDKSRTSGNSIMKEYNGRRKKLSL